MALGPVLWESGAGVPTSRPVLGQRLLLSLRVANLQICDLGPSQRPYLPSCQEGDFL